MWFFGGSTTMVHYELTMNHICSITNHIFSTFLTFMNRYGPRVWHLLAIYVQLQTTVNHYYPLENRWKSRFSTKKSLVILVNYPLSINITINITIHHPVRPVRLRLRHKGGLVGPEKGADRQAMGSIWPLYRNIFIQCIFIYLYIMWFTI